MNLVRLSKIVLLVLSTSCIANAYLTPGQIQNENQAGGWYHPGHGGHDDCSDQDGCWVDPGSGSSPYDPGPYDPQPPYPPPGHGYPPPPPPPPGYPHEPPPYPGQPPGYPGHGRQQIDVGIYRNTYGNDRIDITAYMNLSRYRGWRVEQVIVNGRTTNYGSASLSLIVNGNSMGSAYFSGGYQQSQSIWLGNRPMIGNGADSIVLYTSGQMSVDRVSLIISR